MQCKYKLNSPISYIDLLILYSVLILINIFMYVFCHWVFSSSNFVQEEDPSHDKYICLQSNLSSWDTLISQKKCPYNRCPYIPGYPAWGMKYRSEKPSSDWSTGARVTPHSLIHHNICIIVNEGVGGDTSARGLEGVLSLGCPCKTGFPVLWKLNNRMTNKSSLVFDSGLACQKRHLLQYLQLCFLHMYFLSNIITA